ncbi:MAG: hypothetical protein M0Q91_17575 [Methanoregula sp.]|nr:hypothetical protein [Methanoregula sp.]
MAPPSRFPARVHVGDPIRVIAQKGIGRGDPPGVNGRSTPPPLSFPWEGGAHQGRDRGGGVGIVPAGSCGIGVVATEEKTRAHTPKPPAPTWIRESAAKGIS